MIKPIIEKLFHHRDHTHLAQVPLAEAQAHFLVEVEVLVVVALVEAGKIQLLLYTFKKSLIEQL